MVVVDRLIGLTSPAAALRRAAKLSERKRFAEAFSLLALAARASIPEAEYRVARCYLEGSGVPPSRVEGVRWLQRAAAHGFIEAQCLLATLNLRGLTNLKNGDANGGEGGVDQLFGEDTPPEPDFDSAIK